jgi:hypothetical protein
MAVFERISVFGVYPHFRVLRTSVDVLKSFGFRNEDIGVMFPECAVANTFSFDNQLKKDSQSSDLVRRIEPVIEPLIGGAIGWLTYVNDSEDGALVEALAGFGVSGFIAPGYEKSLRRGELLLAVRPITGVLADRAEGILRRTGAHHILRACGTAVPAPKSLLRADIQVRAAAPGHSRG